MELAGAIISAAVVLFAAWLKWYTGRDSTYADLQTGRTAIKNGDADAVAQRIDKLPSAPANSASGDPAGIKSAEDLEGRISRL